MGSLPVSSVLRNGSLGINAVACCAYWPLGIWLKVQAAFVFIMQVGYSSLILSSLPYSLLHLFSVTKTTEQKVQFAPSLTPAEHQIFQSSVQHSNHLNPAHWKPSISGYQHKIKFISWILLWVCLSPTPITLLLQDSNLLHITCSEHHFISARRVQECLFQHGLGCQTPHERKQRDNFRATLNRDYHPEGKVKLTQKRSKLPKYSPKSHYFRKHNFFFHLIYQDP